MPTSSTVLDLGILLATVQAETYTHHAQSLLKSLIEQEIQIASPILLKYELIAVSRKWVYRGLATEKQAKLALDTLLSYPIELYFDETLLRRAYDLATLFERPTAYDAQYLAVSERLSCEYWTTDQRLFNAIHEKFSNIRFIDDLDL